MSTLSLKTHTRVPKAKPYNKKQAIKLFQKKYSNFFDIKDDAIDLREMAKNYTNDIIPLEDIHQAIVTVIGPNYIVRSFDYDPSGGATITYPNASTSPRFAYVDWDQLYLWSIFQRDVAPNHVEKIYKDFRSTCVIVPCAIRMTLKDGKVIFCIWDGHHTVQVCRLKGYNKFPVWYIDVDHIPLSEIENAGYSDSDEDRIKYGVWLAGTNMRKINGINKRALSPYDDFMIGYETQDPEFVAIMNILRKNNCVPKRHATMAGAFTQIKSGIECYSLADTYGNKAQFWDRALNFHRTVWPKAPLTLEIFRPLSYLYWNAALQGLALPPAFDVELARMLTSRWGDPESVQEGIKDSYWAAYHDTTGNNKLSGTIPEHDKFRVLNGLINLYRQNNGQYLLPPATCQWKV